MAKGLDRNPQRELDKFVRVRNLEVLPFILNAGLKKRKIKNRVFNFFSKSSSKNVNQFVFAKKFERFCNEMIQNILILLTGRNFCSKFLLDQPIKHA